MDADNAPDRRAASAQGGTVEPANRATAKQHSQTPGDMPGERYELHDPFAEATYRISTFPEMVAKAEQLGSSRFVAVSEKGQRTPIQKVNGEWHRVRPLPAPLDLPLNPMSRDEAQTASPVPSRPGAGTAPAQPAQAEQADGKAIARANALAERAARLARLEEALQERYIIKRAPVTVGDVTIGHTEYRFRGDTSRVAFTESTFRLATDTNSPSIARSMIDVAEARNWKALRVSGNEDFRRMAWLEASVRGVKIHGYEPNPGDLKLLKREREARWVNRIEPTREPGSDAGTAPTERASGRGSGGRKAVLAAIEAVLVAKKVPENQRTAVMAAASDKLAQRIRDGQAPKVKVYDKTAPSQRTVVVPAPELHRSRDRAAPAPVR